MAFFEEQFTKEVSILSIELFFPSREPISKQRGITSTENIQN